MGASWVEQAAGTDEARHDDAPLTGVAPAVVVENIDATGQGRVQLELPWLPDVRPWARVAAVGAGGGRGFYSLPQKGDEVLVAFAHGDVTEPYVLGCLWSAGGKPPTNEPQAPDTRRILRTPKGHEMDFDDAKQSITLKTITGHTAELKPDAIRLATAQGTASITLEASGTVTIEGQVAIKLKAPQIEISGTALKAEGSARVQVTAGGVCEIQGGLVKIN